MVWNSLIYAVCLAAVPGSAGAGFSAQTIYGADDRREIFEGTDWQRRAARSVAGKVPTSRLETSGSGFELRSVPLRSRRCPTVRFAEQIIGATCTGFLVGPRLLATAAHCIKEDADCRDARWVFDYALNAKGDAAYTKLRAEQVYACRRVAARRYEGFGAVDYALIELDRSVTGRFPLDLELDLGPALGAPVALIGHPNGLPLKVADSATVLRSDDPRSFETDLDAFQGNSGSPVFDAVSHKVIGMVSHGHADNVREGSCKVPRVCLPGDNCHLDTASRTKNMAADLEALRRAGPSTQASDLAPARRALKSAEGQARALCAGFLPDNDMRIPDSPFHAFGISDKTFDAVLDKVRDVYAPVFAARGANLVIRRLWKDERVNASALREGNDWIIEMYGGLARHQSVTREGMALIACHEIGHHLGGFPKKEHWATTEGGADYFAALKCLRQVLKPEPEGRGDPVASAACEKAHGGAQERGACRAGTSAGLSVIGLFRSATSTAPIPSFSTPDPTVVQFTRIQHPRAQCRLDTFLQGALCTKGSTEPLSETDPVPGACTRKEGYAAGLRPLCWYKPPLDEPAWAAARPVALVGPDELAERLARIRSALEGRR